MGTRREANKIIGWKAIGEWLGISEIRAKRAFRRAGVDLPKVGNGGPTSPVYLFSDQLLWTALRNEFHRRKA